MRAYNASQESEAREVCEALASTSEQGLPDAESKIWHRHPVWFLDGNSIVGYSMLRNSVRLLFLSGQSFEEPGLTPEGKVKTAEVRYARNGEVDGEQVQRWLKDAQAIQWDYKNVVKRRGQLERLT